MTYASYEARGMGNMEADGRSIFRCHFSRVVAGREDPVRVARLIFNLRINP